MAPLIKQFNEQHQRIVLEPQHVFGMVMQPSVDVLREALLDATMFVLAGRISQLFGLISCRVSRAATRITDRTFPSRHSASKILAVIMHSCFSCYLTPDHQ